METVMSGETAKFRLDPNTDLVVSIVDSRFAERLPPSAGTPSNLCPFLRFFRDLEEFQRWREGLPQEIRAAVFPVSVQEAFSIAERLLQ